jgi:hypothetical protein
MRTVSILVDAEGAAGKSFGGGSVLASGHTLIEQTAIRGRLRMKSAFVLALFFAAAGIQVVAQDQTAVAAAEAACGPKDVKFDAKQAPIQHPTPQPETGKALVYLVQDMGEVQCTGCALTRAGVDGSWLGANQGSSYFFFTTQPGEHHLCVNWQSRFQYRARAFAMAKFTAEAGKIYYFRVRFFFEKTDYSFDLDSVDSDQGKFLVASSAFSASRPKK